MKLVPVCLEGLSAIEYSFALAPSEEFATPEFLLVRFVGTYRDGSSGAPDAKFMAAIIQAAQRAWFADGLVLDLSDLSYQWGDEMEWIFASTRVRPSPCSRPLAVIVGDGCRAALKSLSPEDFDGHCVETLEEAVRLVRRELQPFKSCMATWRAEA